MLQYKSLRGAKRNLTVSAMPDELAAPLWRPRILARQQPWDKLTELGDRERVDVILTNPLSGCRKAGIRQNFPPNLQTSETALLFLQLS
jgi:type I restriction enzyme M protein